MTMAAMCYRNPRECSECPHHKHSIDHGHYICNVYEDLKQLVGKTITIVSIECAPREYVGKTGVVKFIDSACQIHGTWGGVALHDGVDLFIVNKE